MAECTHKRRESEGKLVRPSKESGKHCENGHVCPAKIAEPAAAHERDAEGSQLPEEDAEEVEE